MSLRRPPRLVPTAVSDHACADLLQKMGLWFKERRTPGGGQAVHLGRRERGLYQISCESRYELKKKENVSTSLAPARRTGCVPFKSPLNQQHPPKWTLPIPLEKGKSEIEFLEGGARIPTRSVVSSQCLSFYTTQLALWYRGIANRSITLVVMIATRLLGSSPPGSECSKAGQTFRERRNRLQQGERIGPSR